MRRKKEQLSVKIDSELLFKYKYMCKYLGIRLSDQLSSTMLKYVNSFEESYGTIEMPSNSKGE